MEENEEGGGRVGGREERVGGTTHTFAPLRPTLSPHHIQLQHSADCLGMTTAGDAVMTASTTGLFRSYIN